MELFDSLKIKFLNGYKIGISILLLIYSPFAFGQFPNCATINSPTNTATGIGISGTALTWTAAGSGVAPTGYKLYFGTDNLATNITNGTNIGNVTSYSLGTLICNTTYYWKIVPTTTGVDAVGCSVYSFTTSAPGTSSTFGSSQWNAYCYSDNNFLTYVGYYTDNTLNFNSTTKWGQTLSPSGATGYQGCSIGNDNHSVIYKRQGFTTGVYQIDIPSHDDNCYLYINGTLIFSHLACCDSHTNVWTGSLNATSTVEFRWQEFTGNSYGSLTFTSVTAPVLLPGSLGSDQSLCSGDDPIAFTNVSSYSGGCYFSGFQWQSSTDNITYANISGATSATYDAPSGITQTTYYRRAATDVCNSTVYTSPVTVTVLGSVPGDPTVYGNNSWIAYVYKDNNFATYGGYYTESLLSFNSTTKWGQTISPSTASFLVSGYQGCQIPIDNHSVTYKRQGFTVGTYQIDIPNHDDNCYLLINGVQVFSHLSWGDSHTAVWTGNLNATSTVEFKWREFTGNSNGGLTFTIVTPTTLLSGTVGSDQSICSGDDPLPLTNVSLPSGGCYINSYQWQSSTDNITFNNISGATSSTYDPPAITQTTYYRRSATDACSSTAYSNVVTVTIYSSSPGNPAVYGSNIWNVYAYKDNNFATYGGYYTESALSFNSTSKWGVTISPSTSTAAVTGYLGCQIPIDNHSISYKRQGFPVGTYQIDISSHDDDGYIYINGVSIFTHVGCCDVHTNVWTGNLDASSTIEFKWREFSGNSNGSLTFTTATPASSVSAGTIGADQTICYGGDPAIFSNTSSATSTCFVYYQWQSSLDNSTWGNIGSATSSTYDAPAGLTQTTYYRRQATDACGNIAQTPIVTVTVYSNLIVGSIGTAQTICYNATPATLTNVSLPSGGTGSYTYQWQSSPDGTTWSNISSANSTTYSPGTLLASTYYRRTATSGSCGTVYSSAILITVNPNLTAGAVGSVQTICSGASSASLTNVTTPTGGNGTFAYQWQSSPDNSTWTDISGATLITYSPGSLVSSTYFRRKVSSGTSCPAYTSSILITVNPNLAASVIISTTYTTICSGISTTFTATPTAGGATPTYQWKVNGVNKTTGSTYTTSTLANNDVISCVMTSNYSCLSGSGVVSSNSITVTVVTGSGIWIGVSDANWTNPSNWCGTAPSATTDVIINAGVPFMPQINATAVCRNLTVATGATLTIVGTNNLDIKGTWTHNGTFVANNGLVNYSGTGSQTIIPVNYYDLQSSSSGNRILSSTGTIGIGGTFTPGANTYTVTGSTINFSSGSSQSIPIFPYNNISTSGAGSKVLAGNTAISGSLSSSILDLNNNTLTLNGNVSASTNLKGSTTSNLIIGSAASFSDSLYFASGYEQLNNLTINKTGNLLLGTPLTVNGSLTFPSSGYLFTLSSNLLSLSSSATYSGSSMSSFVNGPMAKAMQSTSSFIFPIGKDTLSRKVGVVPQSTSATTFTAEYFNASPQTIGAIFETPPLHHVSSVEYWNISKSGASNAQVQLFWGLRSDVSMNYPDYLSLRVAHFNSGTSIWENQATTLTGGSTYNSGSIVTTSYLSSFSPFTFASTTSNNPLPDDNLSFTVTRFGDNALLKWEHEYDIETSGFVVQKSAHNVFNFDSIGYVKALEINSPTINYQFEDQYFNNEASYYRLKEYGSDRVTAYSPIQQLLGDKRLNLKIIPNPTPGDIKILWNDKILIESFSYSIFNLQGKIMAEEISIPKESLAKIISSKLSGLKEGVYMIKIYSDEYFFTTKIIKVN